MQINKIVIVEVRS